MKTQKNLPYKDCCECEAVYMDILKTKLMALFQKSKQHSQNVSVFSAYRCYKAYQMCKIF